MGIRVRKDKKSGEVVIKLGKIFNYQSTAEFVHVYLTHEFEKNFLVDFKRVQVIDINYALHMLIYLGGVDSTVSITGSNHNHVRGLHSPVFKKFFKFK